MTILNFVIVVIFLLVVLNLVANFVIIFRAPEYSLLNKFLQSLIIWLMPFVGAILILLFWFSERGQNISIEERRKIEDWKQENEHQING